MKGLLSLLAVLLLVGSAYAIPPGFRATPFRPNVGAVPRGVPARNFAPRFNHHFGPAANFGIHRNFGVHRAFVPSFNYGYGVPAASFAFAPSYGYGVPAAAFAPAYAPAFAAPSYGQGCASYFPSQAAFAPSYAPAFATGGCGQYFPSAAFARGFGY